MGFFLKNKLTLKTLSKTYVLDEFIQFNTSPDHNSGIYKMSQNHFRYTAQTIMTNGNLTQNNNKNT